MKVSDKQVRRVGHLLSLVAVVFVISRLKGQFDRVDRAAITSGGFLLLACTVLPYCISNVMSAWAWKILLRGGGYTIGSRDAFVIFARTQIGKYLPGNIFHFAGRAAMGTQYGIPLKASGITMSLEGALAVAAALAMALGGALFGGDDPLHLSKRAATIALVLVPSALALGVGVYASRRFVSRWIGESRSYLSPRNLIPVFATHVVDFLLMGLTAILTARALGHTSATFGILDFAWRMAFAWVIGFIVPGAPGGIGIREAVLLGLFGEALGASTAATVFVLARIANVIGDIITFGVGYALGVRPLTRQDATRLQDPPP